MSSAKQVIMHISIHSLHTEGDILDQCHAVRIIFISIHSLHTEGDRPPSRSIFSDPVFQSTPSTRRETI